MARLQRRCAGILLCCTIGTLVAQQPPLRSVRGRVFDEDGKPVVGAAVAPSTGVDFVDTVALLAKPPAITRDDGSYAVAVDPGQACHAVVIAAKGRQACMLWIYLDPAKDAAVLPDVVLPPGASLIGRVRSEMGAGLAGVSLTVRTAFPDLGGPSGRLLAGAVSDAKGIFVVPCVPRTGLRLTASAVGYLSQSLLVSQQSRIDLTLQEIGMVRGKVIDAAGVPVAGVRVDGVTIESREAGDTVLSAADGTFAITVPIRGRFRVSGYETVAPQRQFSSGLLHGAADDVVLREWRDPAAPARVALTVSVVDAATHEPIEDFHLAIVTEPASGIGFGFGSNRRSFHGRAVLDLVQGTAGCMVADAGGHGFEVVKLPADLGKPLEIALGPEAVLTGRVTDAATGKPMAGVAVGALPKGSSGGGGRLEDSGPLTDADGRYRLTGLRPGEYGVQALAEGRPASPPVAVALRAGSNDALDLQVPEQRWLEFEVSGEARTGIPRTLQIAGISAKLTSVSCFQHYLSWNPVALLGPGNVRLGPLGASCSYNVQMVIPSRTRVGASTAVGIGDFEGAVHVRLDLDRFDTHQVSGRVILPADVPTERIGILATAAGRQRIWEQPRPSEAAVDVDGRFALDLPTGDYCLQVADLLTGIVFHTEKQSVAITDGSAPIVLRPEIHWLAVSCVPEAASSGVVLKSLGVQLERPLRGARSAFLGMKSSNNTTDSGGVLFAQGADRQRWLVPAGPIKIDAVQPFEVLLPGSGGRDAHIVATASVDVDALEQEVTLKIPPPPSDEELLQRK